MMVINPSLKQMTLSAGEAKPNRRRHRLRYDRGAPLPEGKGDKEDRFGIAVARRMSPV